MSNLEIAAAIWCAGAFSLLMISGARGTFNQAQEGGQLLINALVGVALWPIILPVVLGQMLGRKP